jgi:hypothetical protein
MPSYFEANETPYQINPETLSPERPPQLKQTASGCGCRCGTRGAEGEGEGENNDDDNASTLVGSESDLDSDSESPDSSDGPEQHVSEALFQPSLLQGARSMNEVRTRIGIFEIGVEGFQQRQPIVETEPLRPHWMSSFYEEETESMRNQHGSETHSVLASDARSLSSRSPGLGIGAWIRENPQELQELQRRELHFDKHHFLVRPLRLTPHHRDCRGLVTSHKVTPDEDFYGRDR